MKNTFHVPGIPAAYFSYPNREELIPSSWEWCLAAELNKTAQELLKEVVEELPELLPVPRLPDTAKAALQEEISLREFQAVSTWCSSYLLPKEGAGQEHFLFAGTIARFLADRADRTPHAGRVKHHLLRFARFMEAKAGVNPILHLILNEVAEISRGGGENLHFPATWIWPKVAKDFVAWAMAEGLPGGEDILTPWAIVYDTMARDGRL